MTEHHSPDVVRNESASRYEYRVDGDVVGYIDYVIAGDATDLVHTEVAEEMRGTAVARTLAKETLADLAKRDATVVPSCPYLARYLRRCEDCAVKVRWP
ncbi:GNAT family N-acetyltransferase [Demequina globuliformis]|uniref:GNAT family N-acetyltransferase n=1 Tax=Demequina globuliformis TaxID=676202 RepID=UPI000780897C|nr:GNAT family N-acetyltransferase [Demequina globuliformis]